MEDNQTTFSQPFSELGVDPLVGAEVMQLLGAEATDLQDPLRFSRLRDVMGFMSQVQDRSFFVNQAVAGKNVDRLDHIWGLVELHKRRDVKARELDTLDEEISFYVK